MRHTEVPNPFGEKRYSVGEIAKDWNLSADFVRRLFKDEPGVLKIPRLETRHKRGYTTLRIPESVARRVYARFTIKATA